MILLSLFVLISAYGFGNSARILGIIPTPSYSHQVVFRPIWRELSKRGHDLVVMTTDPENDPKLNLTEIDMSFAYDLWNKKYNVMQRFEELKFNPIKAIQFVRNVTLDICTQELLLQDVQTLLKNDTEYFDLVIAEFMMPVMFGFAKRFKCPYIGIISLDLMSVYHSLLGNPTHPVLYPDPVLPFEGELTFSQRVISSLYNYVTPTILSLGGGLDDDAIRQLMEEQFGKSLPPLVHILRNIALIFLNVDPAFYTRPLGPAFVKIGGGTHLTSTKPLPKLIKEVRDHYYCFKQDVTIGNLGTVYLKW